MVDAAGPPGPAPIWRSLEVLANPVRLEILRVLRSPKALREIVVKPQAGGRGNPDRPIARQSVREHIERLLDIGVVVTRPATRDYGDTVEYMLNHRALYALSEEFRDLAKLKPTADPGLATMDRDGTPAKAVSTGPALVQVKGLEEGRAFPLASPGNAPRVWTIGRSRRLDVSLDHDPFVSAEHARVRWDGACHAVEDLEGSRNGTEVNFVPLPKGGHHVLRPGDVIGVGRSLLVFRT